MAEDLRSPGFEFVPGLEHVCRKVKALEQRLARLEQPTDKQPEKRWKDVTAECTFEGSALVYWPIKKNPPNRMVSEANGFRLRKVEVAFTGPGRKFGCEKGSAFIIEKEEAC